MNGLPIVVYNSYTIVNSGRELVENTPLRRQKTPSQALCILPYSTIWVQAISVGVYG